MAPATAAPATLRRNKIQSSSNNHGNQDEHESSSSSSQQQPPSLWLTFCASTLYHISLHLPRSSCTAERCFILVGILPPVLAGILWQRILKTWSNTDVESSRSSTILFYLCVILLILLLLVVISYLSFCYKVSQAYCNNRINANASTLKARAAAAAATSSSNPPRVVFENGYDLYLPPPPPAPPPSPQDDACNGSGTRDSNHTDATTANHNSSNIRIVPCGFFLFPGALVDYRSYASFAMQLSNAGILVVIQNTEPFRFVAWIFGSNHKFCLQTMSEVQTRYNLQVQEWNVGGHSMGGYTCYNLVHALPGVFQKLAWYGVYRPMALQNAGVDVLAVTASCDGYGFQHNEAAQRDFFASLPPLVPSGSVSTTTSSPPKNESSTTRNQTIRTTKKKTNRTIHYDIPGGNHAGFGDNWIQTFPRMDGERTISLEEQHAQMAKMTCQFLLNQA